MRSIDNRLDRFCRKHPEFGVPNLMIALIVGQIAVFVLDLLFHGGASALLSLNPGSVIHELQLWRLVTFIIVPDAGGSGLFGPMWFLLSLFFYYFMGTTMEREWGTTKFTLFYLTGALLTIATSFLSFFLSDVGSSLTLGQIHQSLFLAFATLYPDAMMRFYFVIPIKAKWLALLYVFLTIVQIFQALGFMMPLMLAVVLPPILASWINYAIFFWSDIVAFVRRMLGRTRHQASRQTINFKSATKKAQETRGYLHKCAVCGKTDTDYPGEEFRYCSKCNGYYCYCSEHIGNHSHIE